MERLFAVIQTHGAGFRPVPLEQQEDWRAHADFMNALEAEGIVLVGGPLEGTEDVLLILRGQDADDIRARLAPDPWVAKDLLRLKSVLPWTLRLGEDFEWRWVSRRARAEARKSPGRAAKKPGKAGAAQGKKPVKPRTKPPDKPGKAGKSP